MKKAHKMWNEKPDGRRPLGRPRHRWENIKIDFTKNGQKGVHWIYLAETGTRGGLS
jgi:hypothetical protein